MNYTERKALAQMLLYLKQDLHNPMKRDDGYWHREFCKAMTVFEGTDDVAENTALKMSLEIWKKMEAEVRKIAEAESHDLTVEAVQSLKISRDTAIEERDEAVSERAEEATRMNACFDREEKRANDAEAEVKSTMLAWGNCRGHDQKVEAELAIVKAERDELRALVNKKLTEEWHRDAHEAVHKAVHEAEGKWWFWDETWSTTHGPFENADEAREACKRYAESL